MGCKSAMMDGWQEVAVKPLSKKWVWRQKWKTVGRPSTSIHTSVSQVELVQNFPSTKPIQSDFRTSQEWHTNFCTNPFCASRASINFLRSMFLPFIVILTVGRELLSYSTSIYLIQFADELIDLDTTDSTFAVLSNAVWEKYYWGVKIELYAV